MTLAFFFSFLSLLNRRHHSAQESAPAAIVQPLVALTDPAQHTGPLPVGVVVHRVAEGRAELGTRGAESGDERTRGSLQVCLIRLLIAFTRPGLGGLDVVTEEEPLCDLRSASMSSSSSSICVPYILASEALLELRESLICVARTFDCPASSCLPTSTRS